MIEKSPIFITGIERSGSSMIARILSICGVFTGEVNNMCENIHIKEMLWDYLDANPMNELIPSTKNLYIPNNWKERIHRSLVKYDRYEKGVWMYKDAKLTQSWPIWNYAYPNARWIIVRRRTGDIIQSCLKTGYMNTFKDEVNRNKIKVDSEEAGWLWWIHEYEHRFRDMIEAGVNCKQIWPERMVHGDYEQIYEMLEWLGLKWNSKIFETIDPMLTKSRRTI
jgi:hypothetical protein